MTTTATRTPHSRWTTAQIVDTNIRECRKHMAKIETILDRHASLTLDGSSREHDAAQVIELERRLRELLETI